MSQIWTFTQLENSEISQYWSVHEAMMEYVRIRKAEFFQLHFYLRCWVNTYRICVVRPSNSCVHYPILQAIWSLPFYQLKLKESGFFRFFATDFCWTGPYTLVIGREILKNKSEQQCFVQMEIEEHHSLHQVQ